MAQQPGWISHPDGVPQLLEHLRRHLGQPQLSEMSEHMTKYFKQSKRKKHESMNAYITRKAELYSRACQTLARVQARYEPTSARRHGAWSHYASSQNSSGWRQEVDTYESAQEHDDDEEDPNRPSSTTAIDHWQQGADPWQGWHGYGSTWSSWSWTRDRHHESAAPTTGSASQWRNPELLPSFVQGWFLLQDSGLEAGERNMIMAALKDDFSVEKVAQELRNQWVDDDLHRRDQGGRSSAWIAEMDAPADDDWPADEPGDLSDGGQAMWNEAAEEAQAALHEMDRNRRTLRDARAKQHFARMSRQFHRPDGKGKGTKGTGKGARLTSGTTAETGGVQCLHCGGNHRVAVCPKKHGSTAAAASHTTEAAPFVCYAEEATPDEEACVTANMTTQEAMRQGMAVIDGGATKTLGSVAAVETLMQLNSERNGDPGLTKLDADNRPTFGFGNSSRNQCLSTAWMRVSAAGKPGELKIHTLDQGEGPILLSIETLRSLGAIIDFEHDLAVFRNLDAQRILQLHRSCTGHQLLPLTQDWYDQSVKAKSAVGSLKDFI